MRQMKKSGIEWIGNIPDNWEIERGKNIMTKLERPVLEDDGVITCFRDGQVTLRANRREEGFTVSMQETGYQGIEPGDLVVHGMDGFAGSIGISDSRGKATPVLNVLESVNNKKYLMYYLRSAAYCGLFLSLATGVRIRTCDTNWNKLKNVMYLVPPLIEQQSISDYVDCQCAYVDNIIEKTKTSIEEYKKFKQSIITQAVTKGVRGNRSMKNSGIVWIGEIPEEWKALKFKYVATVKANLVHPNDYADYPQIAPDNIEKGTSKLLDYKTVGEVGVESDNHLFFKGQIIYSKIRPILNKVIIAPFDGLCSADMYPIETEINKKYLVYMMLSDVFLSQVKLVTEDRVKMPKINQEELGQIRVCLPPEDEQAEIVEYLDSMNMRINSLIVNKDNLLSELESYKKSMIYEYVTGKKEVPSV